LRSRVNQDAVVIAGTSAGTAVQGKYIYGEGNSYGYLTFNDLAPKTVDDLSGLLDIRAGNSGFQYDNNGGKMQGFGFLARHMAFDTHFDNRARLGRMIVAMKNLKTTTGIGVDENTALSIHDDIATVYGEHGVFLADSSKAFFSATTKHLNETGVRVSILTNGDSYNFKNKKIHSTKKRILKPQFSGSVESHNLFGSYLSTELMTHLIDQSGNTNLGISDPARPGFKYIFRKDKKSFGNLSNGQYTVQNIIIDILDI
jgi:cyanophycinase